MLLIALWKLAQDVHFSSPSRCFETIIVFGYLLACAIRASVGFLMFVGPDCVETDTPYHRALRPRGRPLRWVSYRILGSGWAICRGYFLDVLGVFFPLFFLELHSCRSIEPEQIKLHCVLGASRKFALCGCGCFPRRFRS